jgi:hypothetical protein
LIATSGAEGDLNTMRVERKKQPCALTSSSLSVSLATPPVETGAERQPQGVPQLGPCAVPLTMAFLARPVAQEPAVRILQGMWQVVPVVTLSAFVGVVSGT